MKNNMISTIFRTFVGTKEPQRKNSRQRSRICRVEELEEREMLSVTFADFDAIRTQYADLNLSDTANASNYDTLYNIIEIAADELTDEKLRDALDAAGTTAQDDLIVIRTTAAQNVLTLGGSELAININATVRGSVTIVSFGTSPLTIDADSQSRIFSVAFGSELALGGLTFTKGQIGLNAGGGAIYNSGDLTITDCTITDNTALANSYGGGGIYNYSYATLTISNSIISGNESLSTTYGGGGIYNFDNATLTLINSVISGNKVISNVTSTGGGGIYNSGDVSVISSTISTNSSAYTSTLATSRTCGGGVFNTGNGTLTITNSTFVGNSASSYYGYSYGGGIYKSGSGTLTITNSTFVGNSASFGSWICNDGSGMVVTDDITDLTTGSLYYVQVLAIGEGNYSNSLYSTIWAEATPVIKLSAPTLGGVTVTNSTTISVAWDEINNASGYTVRYSTDSSFDADVFTIEEISTISLNIDKLNPDTLYHVQVMATGIGKYSNSEWSEAGSATTVPATIAFNTHDRGKVDAAVANNGLIENEHVIWTEIDGELRLTAIIADYAGLTGDLDLSDCTELWKLRCVSNQLTALDISNNVSLKELHCPSNQLTMLDVSGSTALTWMECWDNQLTGLDVSNNTALITLYCSSNPLTTLNVSNNTALTALSCFLAQLTELDVSNNTALTVLHCALNQLTTLDVSNNLALIELSCENNQLTTLDLSNNTALEWLYCNDNELTSLIFGDTMPQEPLARFGSPLAASGNSTNMSLIGIDCANNKLPSLNLTGLSNLHFLASSGNPLEVPPIGFDDHFSLEAFAHFPENIQNGFIEWVEKSPEYYVPEFSHYLPVMTLETDTPLDLSSEYSLHGIPTTFSWYYADGSFVPEDLYSNINGVFEFHGLDSRS